MADPVVDGVPLDRPAPESYEQRWSAMERLVPYDFDGKDSPTGDFGIRSTTVNSKVLPQPVSFLLKVDEIKGTVSDDFGIANLTASADALAAFATARKYAWDLERQWAILRKAEIEKVVYSKLR